MHGNDGWITWGNNLMRGPISSRFLFVRDNENASNDDLIFLNFVRNFNDRSKFAKVRHATQIYYFVASAKPKRGGRGGRGRTRRTTRCKRRALIISHFEITIIVWQFGNAVQSVTFLRFDSL